MDQKVDIKGRVLKFPTGVPVQKAYNFLENLDKLPRSRSWYIMVENQGDCLQVARYQPHKGKDLHKVGEQLKEYYLQIIPETQEVVREQISGISVGGNDKFVVINNVPKININETPLISHIVEDLVSLLNKGHNNKNINIESVTDNEMPKK